MVAASPTTQARHVYRGAEWHRAATAANGATTSFLYDGSNVVGDCVGGSVSRTYVTPFLDQNLSVTDVGSGERLWYSQDGLGSVRTLTDASGAVANRYGYTAFGSPYGPNTNVAFSQRYGYTGREKNPVSGTQYNRYRTYFAGVGRWGARDPVGYADSINVYSYVRNTPTRYVDPMGQACCPDSIAITQMRWVGSFARNGYLRLHVRFEVKLRRGGKKEDCLIQQYMTGKSEFHTFFEDEDGTIKELSPGKAVEKFAKWTKDPPGGGIDIWDGGGWNAGDSMWRDLAKWYGASSTGQRAVFYDSPGFGVLPGTLGAKLDALTPWWESSFKDKESFPVRRTSIDGKGYFEFRTVVKDKETDDEVSVNWGQLIDYKSPTEGKQSFYPGASRPRFTTDPYDED